MSILAGLMALAIVAVVAVDIALSVRHDRRTAARLDQLGRRLEEIQAERERFLLALGRHLAATRTAARKDHNGGAN